MSNFIEAWDNCLTLIKSEVGEQSFNTWFSPIQPIRLENNHLMIQVPSQFFYEYLEEHYVDVLRRSIQSVLGPTARLEYSVVVDNGNETNKALTLNLSGGNFKTKYNPTEVVNPFEVKGLVNINPQLNPNYTFDNLVEGECNLLARNAGLAVSEKPGTTSFNPLLIYGGTGLGKTHLAQSIGNQIKEKTPEKQVLYVSSEKFTNQVIEALRTNKIQEFANFFLQLDVLILDDVQFLAKKDRTQEVFFHIFNTLHQSGKQIILTSDRSPKELKDLQDRLISRFKWGLSAELGIPAVETRMSILQHKAMRDGIVLSKEVNEYLAYNIDTNVRELEGVIIALVAQSSLLKREIDVDLAKQVLNSIVDSQDVEINADYIQDFVSEFFDVSVELLKSKTRRREIVVARQVGMYLTKEFTNLSLKSIGYHYGGRDHTTVIHAINTVNDLIDTDMKFSNTIDDLLKNVKMKAS